MVVEETNKLWYSYYDTYNYFYLKGMFLMKKLLLACVAAFLTAGAAKAAEVPVHIRVNGEYIITDTEPIISSGRTYAPIRAIADSLGAKRVEWNKSVIARIIDNEKYTGLDGFLPIIGIEDYREAQVCKTERTKKQLVKDDSNIGMIRAKMVCQACGERMIRICEPRNRNPVSWTCSNPTCRCKVLITDDVLELRIQERMNLIIENPDLLESQDEYIMDKEETSKDTAEIKRLCDTNNYSEDQLLGKIMSMAVARYDTLQHTPVEVATAVGMAYEKATQQEAFDSELFLQTVEQVILAEDGKITLKLKNTIEL